MVLKTTRNARARTQIIRKVGVTYSMVTDRNTAQSYEI